MNRANMKPPSRVRVMSPLRDFLGAEASGAILLAMGAVIALVWANSPWSDAYDSLWSSRFAVSVPGGSLDLDLQHWVNDGLMTIFFLVVGLEIKRELTDGHLAERRSAMLPALAAVGGMAIPALVYLAIAGSTAPQGWAIPVATDIALAVGVISVAGSRVPASLRAFLLGLAIVDDIGAIVIIAIFYSTGVKVVWLAISLCGVLAVVVLKKIGVQKILVYVMVGIVVWLGLYKGGVHPTLAGVIMGLLAPSTPIGRTELIDVEESSSNSGVESAIVVRERARGSVSVVEWLEHHLHPWTSFLIVPVFALANSGIHISRSVLVDAVGSPITWGVFVGLVVGKPAGILLATKASIRFGLADAPDGSSTRQVFGVGSAAGIGFTVAIFITKLAFTDTSQQEVAKLAILAASILSAGFALVAFIFGASRHEAATRER